MGETATQAVEAEAKVAESELAASESASASDSGVTTTSPVVRVFGMGEPDGLYRTSGVRGGRLRYVRLGLGPEAVLSWDDFGGRWLVGICVADKLQVHAFCRDDVSEPQR